MTFMINSIESIKIKLSTSLSRQIYSLHKKVLNEIINNNSLSLSTDPADNINWSDLSPLLLLFKDDYVGLLNSNNKKIGLLQDIRFYNSLYVDDNAKLLLKSYQDYLIKNDIKTNTGLLKAQSNLVIKANRDADFFIQENYERQDLIEKVDKIDDGIDEREIAVAIATNNEIPNTVDILKGWKTIIDPRTRMGHRDADGQEKKLNEPFVVSGELLKYPADISLGATAKNVVYCRCTKILIRA